MASRIVLNNGDNGATIRSAINSNFAELFDPDYFVAARSTSQSIPHATWTALAYDAPYGNTTSVTMGGSGEMTFPFGGADDASGIWAISGIVAFDNTTAGLQLHTRKIRIRVFMGGFYSLVLATADQLFDPAAGATGELAKSFLQVYAQPILDPGQNTGKMYVEVWHNAKVAGSPVAINSMPVGIEAPLVIGARLSNYT